MKDEHSPKPESPETEQTEAPSGFSIFGLDETILYSLSKMGFKDPTPIQAKAIPAVLSGKDIIALAETGSGKTAACAIPVCQKVDPSRREVQALIIVPTRELALQYATEAQKIGKKRGIKTFAMCGGEDASLQSSKLKDGVQVLIATPGRLIDFIYSRQIILSHVEILILDEADEMFGMGFQDDLEFIINCLLHPHQTLLFSATMPPKIKELAKRHTKEAEEINLIEKKASPERIDHLFSYCKHYERDQKLDALIEELKPVQAIVFCHSRFQVEKVCQALRQKQSAVDFLHAGLTQDVRSIVTNKFRTGKIKILVATDIVARGLDFSKVSHVFIYQLPQDPEVYVHRSGRTGRYDKTGVVISLVTDKELFILKSVLKHLSQPAVWIGDPPPEKAALREKPPQKGRPKYRRPSKPKEG